MGVRIIHDPRDNLAVLYCSTSDWAFGPVFYDGEDEDAYSRAEAFCEWFTDGGAAKAAERIGVRTRHGVVFDGDDPRDFEDHELERLYGEWLREREAVAS